MGVRKRLPSSRSMCGHSLCAKLPNKWYRRLVVIISELFHPIVLMVWQACYDNAEFFFFFFYKERLLFGAPLNVFAILARSGINRVGPLLPRYTILRFGKICPSV